ncbi:MAG: sigma-70 family RNA polymerase sigma factor [Planctomycetota bacterium]
MTESKLLELYLKNGDASAFESLVQLHEGSLLRFARRLTGDASLAQDVVQETFVRLVTQAADLREHATLTTWLYRVCRNLCLDVMKKESRMRRRESQAALPEGYHAERAAIEALEERALVGRKLQELPPNQREVIFLKIVKGMSYRQISEITGHSTGHVGYLIHHGLKHLAYVLKAAGVIEALPGEMS